MNSGTWAETVGIFVVGNLITIVGYNIYNINVEMFENIYSNSSTRTVVDQRDQRGGGNKKQKKSDKKYAVDIYRYREL